MPACGAGANKRVLYWHCYTTPRGSNVRPIVILK